ncbi:MAG: PSD1 and planctomycete cytochrome C domain-containing protein [Opitutaceae bacterium]
MLTLPRIAAALLAATLLPLVRAAPAGTVEFNRDIRPLLAEHCFACHGPDAAHRKGKLRLDVREEAIARGAIRPGRPEASELLLRLASPHADEVMPPPEANKPVAPAARALLARWIREGAPYQPHWAYTPPERATIPPGENGVDHLIGRSAATAGLTPAPAADRRTLIRRLHADLTGLPPSPAEVAAFIADPAPDAYAALVERLLASPHHGERLALGWLDAVRYADTIGYHSDNPRNVWPYRDWVVRSFHRNQRFDRFTLEQIAGDLLPDASDETRVASGFNRLLLSTEEGGAQPKDYESRMLADRVRAIGTAWLGQTTGCAQCHDHKFDPWTMRDFYALGAFFADVREPAIGRREEGMLVLDAAQRARLTVLQGAEDAARAAYESLLPGIDAAQPGWEAAAAAEPAPAGASATTDRHRRQVRAALAKAPAQRTERERTLLRDHHRSLSSLGAPERAALAAATAARQAYHDSLPKSLVTISVRPARVVRLQPRGNWMDESGEVVTAALPAFLPGPDFGGRIPDRLDLARWLVSAENPLTARAVVNRLWAQFFGLALSRQPEDLGSQGELPPQQPLLDWLAAEFMASGWDLRHVIRTIVLSRAYRRSSAAEPAALAADPENRSLARQGSFRLEAELIRDHALAAAGLLALQVGGPPVKPYQPAGYWANLNFPPRDYAPDAGAAQYRRGLYVWWQRTFLHPSLLAFDAPPREECVAGRARSNVPQQALVLLNDPTYVEAARGLALRVLAGPPGHAERIDRAWQLALQRAPAPAEQAEADRLLARHTADYRRDPAAARAFLATGQLPVPAGQDPTELAAWTHLARVLLNLHEFLTRS